MGRVLMLLLVTGLVLAVAKAVIITLVLMIVLLLAWSAFNKPRETVGWLVLVGWLTLLQSNPVAGLLTLALTVPLLLLAQRESAKARKPEDAEPALLTHADPHGESAPEASETV